jgi:hypothetical protein
VTYEHPRHLHSVAPIVQSAATYAASLKKQQSDLDNLAAQVAGHLGLAPKLLPRAAYPPGKLTQAVIEVLEGREHDDNTNISPRDPSIF